MDVQEHFTALLGPGGVGKTALTMQFVQQNFIEEYDPTIEDNYRKQIKYDGKCILFDIFDTAGEEEFSEYRDQELRKRYTFILVFSITSRSSFESLDPYYVNSQIKRIKGNLETPTILVGNKCDLENHREVSPLEGAALAAKYSWKYFETSAKIRINVEEIFTAALDLFQYQGNSLIEKAKVKKKCHIQ